MKVPWLPKNEIAKKAEEVISGYQDLVGDSIAPPIPVEDIIKDYLGLKLCSVDFETQFGMKGILGATYVKQKLICVNERLIADNAGGRLSFTGAHEVGHWILHRKLVNKAQRYNFSEDTIFCRSKDFKMPIEWQADYFASCLLMPERFVRETFQWMCGLKPLQLFNVKKSFDNSPVYFDPCVENWPLIAGRVCSVGNFINVSKQAMIIRLQNLGLVINNTRFSMGWNKSNSSI